MTTFDELDPGLQAKATQAVASDTTFIAPDLDIPDNILDQAAKDAEYTSYAASANTMQNKLNQAFIDRQSLLIENHITPVVSLDDGVTQDKLRQLDQQIDSINSTTRLKQKILTNEQVKNQVRNDFLKVAREQAAGSADENMLSRAVSSGLGWIEGAHYDYKKTLLDAASMVATGAATAATGGGSLIAESAVGGAGFGLQNVADQARSNQALRVIGLAPKSLFRAGVSGFISGAAGTAGTLLLGKAAGKLVSSKVVRDFVNDKRVHGYPESSVVTTPEASAANDLTPETSAANDLTPETSVDSDNKYGVHVNKTYADVQQTKMYVADVRTLSAELKAAMASDDPDVRAAAHYRSGNAKEMFEDLDDNIKACGAKTK